MKWQAECLNIGPRNSRTDYVGVLLPRWPVSYECVAWAVSITPTGTWCGNTCAVGLFALLRKS